MRWFLTFFLSLIIQFAGKIWQPDSRPAYCGILNHFRIKNDHEPRQHGLIAPPLASRRQVPWQKSFHGLKRLLKGCRLPTKFMASTPLLVKMRRCTTMVSPKLMVVDGSSSLNLNGTNSLRVVHKMNSWRGRTNSKFFPFLSFCKPFCSDCFSQISTSPPVTQWHVPKCHFLGPTPFPSERHLSPSAVGTWRLLHQKPFRTAARLGSPGASPTGVQKPQLAVRNSWKKSNHVHNPQTFVYSIYFRFTDLLVDSSQHPMFLTHLSFKVV